MFLKHATIALVIHCRRHFSLVCMFSVFMCCGSFVGGHTSNSHSSVDPTDKPRYLNPSEFEKVFKMSSEKFYSLPGWKQVSPIREGIVQHMQTSEIAR